MSIASEYDLAKSRWPIICLVLISGRHRLLHKPVIKTIFKLIGMMVFVQMILGTATLLLQIPTWLGGIHWAGARLLSGAMLINVPALSRLWFVSIRLAMEVKLSEKKTL